jgi:amidase
MATLGQASSSSRDKVTVDTVQSLLKDLDLTLPVEHLEQWKDLIASVQDSVDVVDALQNYVPVVDLERFPRTDIHRPPAESNPGNAWAWKFSIQGEEEGPLKGVTVCLKDNICVKDVPMLVGTDVFTDYIPDGDASMSFIPLRKDSTAHKK